MRIIFYFTIYFLSLFSACNSIAESKPSASFNDHENAGFYALRLPIIEKTKAPGKWIILSTGTIGGKFVGLKTELLETGAANHPGTKEIIFSLPEQNNNQFLKLFASSFGIELPKTKQKKSVTLNSIVSEGSVPLSEGGKTKLEVINISEYSDYGEWYLEIDLGKGVMTFSEKNQQYRKPFISIFFD